MSEPDPNPMPLGRVEGAVAKLFTKPAGVQAVVDVADGFRLVTLAGAALRQVAWSPGQKVQVLLGGWVQRTYTPLAWDPDAGVTQLLAYAHGTGPGAAWARALRVGGACHLFGPRRSLELSSLGRPALLFGDETSFGLAHALRFTPHAARDVHIVLEVGSSLAARAALAAIGVADAHLVERRARDAHLAEVQELASELCRTHAIDAGALSGKATSIARLGKHLRQLGVPRSRLLIKAYWAEGKTGLD
ncbi:MAG TPA: siderophore-interacting protein [Polyangiaceae bacterium]|nr:siderophore-interacting protein [Polyangiaceae bacterium]